MPKFIIERNVPGASKLTDAEIRETHRSSRSKPLRKLGPEIQWIHSFITDDKIYCIYFSPDETLIRGARPDGGSAGRSRRSGAPAGGSRELQRRGTVTSGVVSAHGDRVVESHARADSPVRIG